MDDKIYQISRLLYNYLNNVALRNLSYTCRTLFYDVIIYDRCNYYVDLEKVLGKDINAIKDETFIKSKKYEILQKIIQKYSCL